MLYKNKIEIIINSILLLIKKIIHKRMKKVLANNDKDKEICNCGGHGCYWCWR